MTAVSSRHCSFVQAYIRIVGTKGKLPKKQLIKKLSQNKNRKKGHFKFVRGSTHVFKMDGKDIGDVTSITLEVNCLVFYLSKCALKIVFGDFCTCTFLTLHDCLYNFAGLD